MGLLLLLALAVQDLELKGVVRLDPPFPKERRIKGLMEDAHCKDCHTEAPFREDLRVDAKGGLKWAFVHVSKGLEGTTYPVPETPAVLDQKGCLYAPYVLGVQVGQKLEIRNSDRFGHNVHGLGFKNPEFSFSQAPGAADLRIFKEPETMMFVKCDIHPWMGARIGVLPHPCFAVSDETGAFTIPKLPKGKLTITLWHERMEPLTREVELPAAGTLELKPVLRKD